MKTIIQLSESNEMIDIEILDFLTRMLNISIFSILLSALMVCYLVLSTIAISHYHHIGPTENKKLHTNIARVVAYIVVFIIFTVTIPAIVLYNMNTSKADDMNIAIEESINSQYDTVSVTPIYREYLSDTVSDNPDRYPSVTVETKHGTTPELRLRFDNDTGLPVLISPSDQTVTEILESDKDVD